ncbi:MAG: hypothetical protein HQL39_16950 [Alphaproteobacteria bacterium]|nr:hypothetical protein [Alphaproteobacteria bacterium]
MNDTTDEAGLRDSLSACPMNVDVAGALSALLLSKARRLAIEGNWAEAEAAAVESARLTMEPVAMGAAAELAHRRAVCLLDVGADADAEAALRHALTLNPMYDPARALLAKLLLVTSTGPGRERALREAWVLAPDNAEIPAELAVVVHNGAVALASHGRIDEAEAAFREAALLAPSLAGPITALSILCGERAAHLVEVGRFDEAEADLRESLWLRPGEPRFTALLNQCLQRRTLASDDPAPAPYLGDRQIALRELRHQFPDDLGIRNSLAIVLMTEASNFMRLGSRAAARMRLFEAMALNPSVPEVRASAAELLFIDATQASDAGRDLESTIRFRQALWIAPDWDAARQDHAVILLRRAQLVVGADHEAEKIVTLLAALTPPMPKVAAIVAAEMINAIGLDDTVPRVVLARCVEADDEHWMGAVDAYGRLCIGSLAPSGTAREFHRLSAIGERKDVCYAVIADHALQTGFPDLAALISRKWCSDWPRLFTVASIALFQTSGDATDLAPPRRSPSGAPQERRLAVSSLGHYGRFAHTVLDYLGMRRYAARHGLVLETPDWVGHYLFELDDPLYVGDLPFRRVKEAPYRHSHPLLAGTDAFSPGGVPPSELPMMARQFLRIRPRWLPMLEPALEAVRRRGRTVIGIHLRRGDRIEMGDVSPVRIYHEWLEENLGKYDAPVVFLASDDPHAKNDFARFDVVTLDDVAAPWGSNAYLQDFFVLMNADIVARSTGTFCDLVEALNTRARLLLRPASDNSRLVERDPWRARDTDEPSSRLVLGHWAR